MIRTCEECKQDKEPGGFMGGWYCKECIGPEMARLFDPANINPVLRAAFDKPVAGKSKTIFGDK